MSLVFAFLCTTKQAKVLTFKGSFDFHIKLAKRNKIGFKGLDKTVKKDFTENKLKKDKDQTLEFAVKPNKCIEASKDMSPFKSSVSKSMRLHWKLKVSRRIEITKDK